MDAIKSKIVLAGDPMQLDPVYTSNNAKTLAEKFGYCTSLMGYLFNRTCYKSEFNSKLIVQLKKIIEVTGPFYIYQMHCFTKVC